MKLKSFLLLFVVALFHVSVFSQSFTTNPDAGDWSNQPQITVSWSALTNEFSVISGYQYIFDQNVQTSTCGSSYTFTTNPSAASSILGSGIYYFHLWAISSSGTVSPVVHTVGPFFLDSNAPNIPVLKDIPDIKLLKDSTSVTLFNLSDYVNSASLNWSWTIETNWRHNTDLGTQISQSGGWITYSPNTVAQPVGRQRIKYSANGIFNKRSIIKLSSYLWNAKFPDAIFKNGQPVENSIIPLMNYLSSAGNCTTPQFNAQVIGVPYVSVTVQGNNLILGATSTIPYPSRIRVRVTGSDSTLDWDSQILWVRENWMLNGDFLSDGTSYWVYQNGADPNNPNMAVNWLPMVNSQTGVVQLTQWGDSSVKMIQNVNNNPNAGNPLISVHGGSWYTLRAKFMTDNTSATRTVSLQMHGYSGYAGDTEMTSVGLTIVPAGTIWHEYEVSFYARGNLAAVVIVSNTKDSSTSSLYIDDIELLEKEPDANNAYGNTSIPLTNGNFVNDLSGWGFQGVYGPLQMQDTAWFSSYNGRNGVCELNSTALGRTKFTQIIPLNNVTTQQVRLRVWAATDAPDQTVSPILVMAFNTLDAQTIHILDVEGYADFHVAAGGQWARYDFACPVSGPLLAVQIQGWDLYSTDLYLTGIQLDCDQDSSAYWSNDEINQTELVVIDTANSQYFTTAESNERFIPYGSNFSEGFQFGFQDVWWNPFSEDSFTSLYLDENFDLLESLGGNVIKLSVILNDFLPDFDYEITPTDTTGEYFPTYQSITNVQIPPRILDRLDQIIAMARRHHLRVILTIPLKLSQSNWWLAGGGNFGDTVQVIISQFWTDIAQRYQNDPTIMSYSFLNEQWGQMREWQDTNLAYSLPFQAYYYTAPVTAQWQSWLQNKYGTIANLNTAWGAIPSQYLIYGTGIPYSSFNAIPIPGNDGKNTFGSSAFTGGIGGGGDSTYHIPDSPIRTDSGNSNIVSWIPSGDTTYLGTYYIWRKEKSIQDLRNFGTTWQYLQPVSNNVLSFTDNNVSSLSTYQYEVTGGNLDAWRNYPEGTIQNQNATYDPMLFDYLLFRESVVDNYNYNQSSALVQVETGGAYSIPRHLISTGLAQFDYLYRWPATQRLWGGPPSLTPEGPLCTMGYNPRELVKSLDFVELSYYPEFPWTPATPDNPNTGYNMLNSDGGINFADEMVLAQYLRTLLRLSHSNPDPALSKPILLKEFGGIGTDPIAQNQWNNFMIDFAREETAGFVVWYFTDEYQGLYNYDYGLTLWGASFQWRADDLKSCDYAYPAPTRTLEMTGGISTSSNYMFLLTASQYRDENVDTSYDPLGQYYTLGRLLKGVQQGTYLPSDHLDLSWPDNSQILRKPGF